MLDQHLENLKLELEKQHAAIQLIMNKYWVVLRFMLVSFFVTGFVFGLIFSKLIIGVR
jgi:hypothetical protein